MRIHPTFCGILLCGAIVLSGCATSPSRAVSSEIRATVEAARNGPAEEKTEALLHVLELCLEYDKELEDDRAVVNNVIGPFWLNKGIHRESDGNADVVNQTQHIVNLFLSSHLRWTYGVEDLRAMSRQSSIQGELALYGLAFLGDTNSVKMLHQRLSEGRSWHLHSRPRLAVDVLAQSTPRLIDMTRWVENTAILSKVNEILRYHSTLLESEALRKGVQNAAPSIQRLMSSAGHASSRRALDDRLQIAAREGNKAGIADALANGARVECREGTTGWTPLHWSALRNYADIARLLLAKGATVDARDNRHRTPLHFAAEKGHADVVNILLKHGADTNAECKPHGETPFFEAANEHRLDIARTLLEHGANPNVREKRFGGFLLLYMACRNNEEMLRLLLEHGSDVKVANNEGQTALFEAVEFPAIVKLLLEHGADVKTKDKFDETPLHAAARGGPPEVVRLFLTKGADINAQNKMGWTPLVDAVMEGHTNNVSLLLKKGAKVTLRDAEQATVLHRSAERGRPLTVEMLLDAKADVKAQDADGRTPLHYSALVGSAKAAEVLLRNGAAVDARDNEQRTPLHYAPYRCDTNIVQVLLKHGAEVNARDKEGKTPLGLWTPGTTGDVIKLLKKHGAKE